MLLTKNISKQYLLGNVQALENINVKINENSFTGIKGPSGCGKSTLLNILSLCDKPSSGELFFLNKKINFNNKSELTKLRRTKIGYVFQYFHLIQTLNTFENIELSLLLQEKSEKNNKEKVYSLLKLVGLENRAQHFPNQLSGGEMQRVAICRALAHQPALIVCDEPTGNLDSVAGSAVIDLLKEAKNSGSAIIMASHSDECLSHCDRVIKLKDGKII